jgi:hypothetical protein
VRVTLDGFCQGAVKALVQVGGSVDG